jgi:hypothetical protein
MADLALKLIKPDKNSRMLGSNGDGTDDMHIFSPMPFPLCARECVLRRATETRDDESWIITRTHKGRDARSVRTNPLRVTVDMHIAGYYMEAVGEERTRVTYLVGCDLNGIFALDWMARKAVRHRLKASVNGNINYVKELKGEKEEGVKGALDMGSIFGGGGDEEEGAFEMTTNVKARKISVEKITSPLHEDVG